MATGKILQFDHIRGYGFVAADDGDDDVFLHASAYDGDPYELARGMRVEFKIMAGDRGRKAFDVRVLDEPAPAPPPQPVPVPYPRPVLAPPPPAAVPSVLQGLTVPMTPEPDEEAMCDVLSPAEFSRELTELLIGTVPELTGQQIVQIRHGMLEFAKKHGWSDG